MNDVRGHCPACGRESLFLGDGGYITCSVIGCPRPDAASELLEDAETQHIVKLDAEGFTIRHPLIERLDDALMNCDVDDHVRAAGPPDPEDYGVYRITRLGPESWAHERKPE